MVDARRTPIGRHCGALSDVRPDDLAALVLRALLERNPSVAPEAIADVVWGAANQAGEDNRNVARLATRQSADGAGAHDQPRHDRGGARS